MAGAESTIAVEGPKVLDIPGLHAETDLSAQQFHFVKAGGNARQVVAIAAETDHPLGVLQNNPVGSATQLATTDVLSLGVSKVAISNGVTLAFGDLVTTDASGKAKAATSGDWTMGTVLDGGTGTTGNVLATVMLTGPYLKA